jgi:hypothetical protein
LKSDRTLVCCAVSSDASLLFVSDGVTAKIYGVDWTSGAPVVSKRALEFGCTQACFSKDGQHVAVVSDGTVLVVSVHGLEVVARIKEAKKGVVSHLCYSANGAYFATADTKGQCVIYKTNGYTVCCFVTMHHFIDRKLTRLASRLAAPV